MKETHPILDRCREETRGLYKRPNAAIIGQSVDRARAHGSTLPSGHLTWLPRSVFFVDCACSRLAQQMATPVIGFPSGSRRPARLHRLWRCS
jgi:hypothetical protein